MRLCSVVVNLVSAVDTVFEELNLDLLLLLLILSLLHFSSAILPFPSTRTRSNNRDDKNDLL